MTDRQDFNRSAWANMIDRMDVVLDPRLFLVWHFADGTIYTLGYVDRQVVFRADTPPGGTLTVDPTSIITANPAVRTNADPDRVTGAIYNDSFRWVAPG
jgi:hypothetical protein